MENLTLETFKHKIFNLVEDSDWNFKGTKPAILDFWAPWCGPCKSLTPILEKVYEEYGEKIDVYKINVDDNYELSKYFKIRSVPTIMFIPMEGTPVSMVGSAPKHKIEENIKNILLKETVS